MYRDPGSTCVMRYVNKSRLALAMPVRVVKDQPDLTVLYLAAGSPLKARIAPDGVEIARGISHAERHGPPLVIGDREWRTNNTLILVRPAEPWDIRLFWNIDTGEFRGWYVNLQTPVVRTGSGFESYDHILDITVAPDHSWSWKDEDEMVEAVSVGRFTPKEAAGIRADGERVVREIEAWRWPFNAGYEHWRPDPSWEVPGMPDDWNAGLSEDG